MTRPNRTARRLRWALLLVGVVAVVLVGYTGYQALKVRTSLQQVASEFDVVSKQVTDGDPAAARRTLVQAQRHAAEARSESSGPGWWLSAHLPVIGPNVDAVRTVAQVADSLAADVLPDVIDASELLSPARLQPSNGRVDLEPIRQAEPTVVRAAAALHTQFEKVDTIDSQQLAPQIAGPVDQLRDKVGRADSLADRASRGVRLLPAMLGGDGKRTYLFMFQNNAEVRATGGLGGAFATITADRGRVKLIRQDTAQSIREGFATPPTPLREDEKEAFAPTLGTFPQNVTSTPDFPRAGQLIGGMYRKTTGDQIDGVISVDPIALSYLLRGTGPVKAPGDRSLTAQNAVDLLLRQVYADIATNEQQNVFFKEVARTVFDKVTTGGGNPRALLDDLVQGVSERRVLVWSRRPAEQKLLQPTALGGALPSPSTTTPQIGVYFNSSRPSKLEYYLDYDVSVQENSCRARQQDLTVSVKMTSRVPKAVNQLPDYVAGKFKGFARGTMFFTTYVFVPEGAEVRSLTTDGTKDPYTVRKVYGRSYVVRSIALKQGVSSTLKVRMFAAQGQTRTPDVRVTPGVRSTGVGAIEPAVCS